MTFAEFNDESHELLKFIAEALFHELHEHEALNLALRGESSDYIRWNKSKVRQNTSVLQRNISFEFQSHGRRISKQFSVQGSLEWDLISARDLLNEARKEAEVLPPDPFFVGFSNHGTSSSEFKGQLLPSEDIIPAIAKVCEKHDLAGLYAAGTVATGNRNSKGQSHWFANESFFMDYSIYNQHLAAKSCYAGFKWEPDAFVESLQLASSQLEIMNRPRKKLSPGKYKVYLAPAAVSEIISIFSWGALSYRTYKNGGSAFKKLFEKEKQLSRQFSMRENFHLGLTPRFNDVGELAPEKMEIIDQGELQRFLVSSRSAKEYSVPGNYAAESEGPRSLEILAGTLPKDQILDCLDTGLYLSNLHYINWSDVQNARLTGMTRYACLWVENGKVMAPIEDMRFDVSLFDIFGEDLLQVTDFQEVDPSVDTYFQRSLGGRKIPGMVIQNFHLTL